MTGSELSETAGEDGEYVDERSDDEGEKAGEDDLEEKLKSKGSLLQRASIA